MKPPYFMENRIRTQLKRNGLQYQFFRSKLDKFKQPTEELEQVADIKGLYHESNSYIQTTGSDASIIRTSKSPMILCMYEDAKKIVLGDKIEISGKQYKVSGVLNIQNYNVAADISLEEVI